MRERLLSRFALLSLLTLMVVQPGSAVARPALEIVGPSGTRALTLAQIRKLPATAGLAGVKSSTGRITPPVRYRGVALEDLLAGTAGFDASTDVVVLARDGYSMTLSFDQVTKGTFAAYDPSTGDSLAPTGALTPILAYECDGKALNAETDGALRLVIVGRRNDRVTDGHWWVKWVTRVELGPVRREWTLLLEGAMTETMDRATFESGASPGCHGATWKDERGRAWTGIPLWLLVGRVDDGNRHGGGAFSDSLAAAGYAVDVVAGDGRRVTFDGARLRRNDGILIAYPRDGAPLSEHDFPLRLVGADVRKDESLGGIGRIAVRPPPATPRD